MAGDAFVMQINECAGYWPCHDPADPHVHVQIIYVMDADVLDDIVFDTRIYKNDPQQVKNDELDSAAALLMMFHINDVTMGGPFVKRMNPRDIYKGPRSAEK